MIHSFKNDYSEGAHPKILEALIKYNFTQQDGYGDDEYSLKAKDLIRQKMQNLSADIHFVSGGTQANVIVISALLRPHESVISAHSGHINTHEAGAIEARGHKINFAVSPDGKLTPKNIQDIVDEHNENIPHMVKPKLVYISNATEVGTIYKKQELEEISAVCKKNALILFMDGARLGSAIVGHNNDLSLSDISRLTDVFYIGGTKNGALIGEAIVINNKDLQADFGYHLKLHGALLAKGRLLGIQFLALFENDLYFNLAKHSNKMALKISDAFKKQGYSFLAETSSNQVFPILPNTIIEKLQENYGFYVWQKIDEYYSAVRIICSWATSEEVVDGFVEEISYK